MVHHEVLVTAVIPAYNVEATIDTTLDSVRNQTHRNLEIVVVIDGATDATESVVRRHAEQDDRIAVVVTPNHGLCAARNTGARAGRGEFIAPIDGDDVWHPEKIRKQLLEFAMGGDDIGMVYTLFRRIDQWDFLIRDGAFTCWSGEIFDASLLYNCVGNGSSIMLRRKAFEQAGGYSMALNRRGCEDYLLQLLISHDWTVGVVPEYLTGYRFDQGSMSRDHTRMALARLKMLDIIGAKDLDVSNRVMTIARSYATTELAIAYIRAGNISASISAFATAARINARATATYIPYRLRDFAFRFIRNAGVRLSSQKPPKFNDLNPEKRFGITYHPQRSRTMLSLLRDTPSSNGPGCHKPRPNTD
ncbi:MAG: glycosyltransferase family 2 protein [Paracoccaceae bacterium]|nr:glycosyltransferase family 2 protein [Paracoccaceae bacterium]